MKIFNRKNNLLIFCFFIIITLIPLARTIAPGGGSGGGGGGGGSGYSYFVYGDVLDRHDEPVNGADVTVIGVYGEEKTDETDENGRFVATFSYSSGGIKSFIIEVTYSDYALERVVVSETDGWHYDPSAIIHIGPEYYAVLVGISNDDASELCDNSISLWYQFLTEEQGMDFHQEDIKVYGTDESGNKYPDGYLFSTVQNVKAGLSWMYATADADDVTVFIYCGHGGNYTGGSYFELMFGGKLYDYTLASYIKYSAAERIFCSIDCCYAGGFGPDIRDNPLNGERTYTVTSTDANSTARGVDVDTWEWTVWTKKFLVDEWYSSNPDTALLENLYTQAYIAMNNDPNIDYLPEEYDGNPSEDFTIR